jgi:hypothetical protein
MAAAGGDEGKQETWLRRRRSTWKSTRERWPPSHPRGKVRRHGFEPAGHGQLFLNIIAPSAGIWLTLHSHPLKHPLITISRICGTFNSLL